MSATPHRASARLAQTVLVIMDHRVRWGNNLAYATVIATADSPTSATITWKNGHLLSDGTWGYGVPETKGWQIVITDDFATGSKGWTDKCYPLNVGPGTQRPVVATVPDFANDPNWLTFRHGQRFITRPLLLCSCNGLKHDAAGCNWLTGANLFTSCTASTTSSLILTPGVAKTISINLTNCSIPFHSKSG